MMTIDKFKNFGYTVRDNYVLSENDSLNYKIRILIPFGFNREDLLIFPYSSMFLGIMDNFFNFPCKVDYSVGSTYIILKFNVFDLHNIPIVLASVFNFMETMEVEKLLEKVDDESLLDKFLKANEKMYNEGIFEFLSYKGKSISDLMYSQYQFLSTKKDKEILDKLNKTKEEFKEEKCIVFIQGLNVCSLKNETKEVQIDKVEKCNFNTNNKFSKTNNAKIITLTFEKNSEDRINYLLNLYLIDFYAELFETNNLILNVPNELTFYFNTDIDKYGPNVLTREWAKEIFKKDDENFRYLYEDFKVRFIEKLLSNYDDYDNNIDKAIEVFTGNEIFYTKAEIIESVNQITERSLDIFINDIYFIIELLENKRNEELENVQH